MTARQQTMLYNVYLLRMFAVFSVVISMSGSVKYSADTHLPFSDPATKQRHTHTQRKKMLAFTLSDAWGNKTKQKNKSVWSLCSSQTMIMFYDSLNFRDHNLFSLPSLLSICSVCFFLPLWWVHAHTQKRCCLCTCGMWSTCIHLRQSSSSKHIAVFSYQPRSTLSRGLSAVPSSPPCSGSAAGWCPPPWSASSPWTRPPPPAAARRLQTPWTGWSKRGCCTNSSAGAEQRVSDGKGGGTSNIKTGGKIRWGVTEMEVIRNGLRHTCDSRTCKCATGHLPVTASNR